jgi:anti-anti-sigma factor
MLEVFVKNCRSLAILCLRGRIVVGETTTLRNAVNEQTGISEVILDLSWVNRIDASGLGVLLELREQTLSRGMRFKLKNVTQPVRRVLEITKLDSVFDLSNVSSPGPLGWAASLVGLAA